LKKEELLKTEDEWRYWPSAEGQQRALDNEFLDLLDSLHEVIERIDEMLKDNIIDMKVVMALHFAAIFDRQHALNAQLFQYSKNKINRETTPETLFEEP